MIDSGQQTENSRNFPFRDWNDFIEQLASGQLSVMEAISANHEEIYASQDYERFINQTRASYVMMQDVRILERLRDGIGERFKEHTGEDLDQHALSRDVKFKDGIRLFGKLDQLQAEAYGNGPRLISGTTFDECLAQYQSLIGYVEELWNLGCDQFAQTNYPLATFFRSWQLKNSESLDAFGMTF